MKKSRYIAEQVTFALKGRPNRVHLCPKFPVRWASVNRPSTGGRLNILVLKPDDDFRTLIRLYSYVSESTKELERKMSFDGGFLETFDDEEACKDESLEFITIHHPVCKSSAKIGHF